MSEDGEHDYGSSLLERRLGAWPARSARPSRTEPDRNARLDRLRAELEGRLSGHLFPGSHRIVFGEGNPDAAMMLIGEGPGETEDRLGRPFVGRAGKLLDRALEAAGIRRENVWITNIVKMRTADQVGDRWINRPPRSEEIEYCAPILAAELDIIRPRVVVCLGSTAASALVQRNFPIGSKRGIWFPGPFESRLVATYHPSYLLRLTGPTYERVFSTLVGDLAEANRVAHE